MGTTSWSSKSYDERWSHRLETGTDGFEYDREVKSTGKLEVHNLMNPLGVIRESRDSEEHPLSKAIIVIQDVTGSMSRLPKMMCEKLKILMSLLIQKGYIEHPQILFGAVGDATCDRVPVQIGQFESGIEMDDDLSRLVLEGGGGVSITESYELVFYFAARKTLIDCWTKRSEKGYLFIVGDEIPYDKVSKTHVRKIFGDNLQTDIPIKNIINETLERYEVFILVPRGSSNFGDERVISWWREYFGQHVIELDDINKVSETIATLIGLTEEKVELSTLTEDLKEIGIDDSTIDSVTVSLTKYAETLPSKTKVKNKMVKSTTDENVETV